MQPPAESPQGPRLPVPDSRRCIRTKANGERCASAALRGTDQCVFHAPRTRHADPVDPTLTLGELSHLDFTEPQSLAKARTGVWQHLLAGSMAPHVAKVALDVAETLAEGARKATAKGSTATAIRRQLASLEPDAAPEPPASS